MKFSAWLFRCALAVLLCALVNGCLPPDQSPLEDEKEPHFIEGKHAVNTYDFNGAIDEFEKAVKANPQNASAHFELGWLYEEKEPDPAAAIYHYQQFLKLRPTADTAEAVKQRIANCKIDLAKGVMPLPSSPGVQHELEQLVQSNKQLQLEVDQWRAWYKTQTNRAQPQVSIPTIQPTQTTTQSVQPIEPVVVTTQTARTNPPAQTVGGSRVSPHVNTVRTAYTVQPKDTLASISRKFNVKLPSLIAANPGLEARKLQPGQIVNIP
jgi:LysM repeat protein